MAESPASVPLHHVMTEINGVKSQWEALIDRISQGYGDAYKKHVEALDAVRKKRKDIENANREALIFLFSVVSMGFAGGAVGSLFANWTKGAADNVAKYAFREGLRGVASETAKKSMGAAVTTILSGPSSGDGLDPVVATPWEDYLEKKTRLDTCFARVNEHLTTLITTANKESWSEAVGQEILDSWRKYCPLLVDAPKADAPPKREDMARGAEVLMWVAWCNAQDLDEQYDAINFLLVKEPKPNTYYAGDSRLIDAAKALVYLDQLKPVMHRIMFLVGYGALIIVPEKWEKLLPQGWFAPLEGFPVILHGTPHA